MNLNISRTRRLFSCALSAGLTLFAIACSAANADPLDFLNQEDASPAAQDGRPSGESASRVVRSSHRRKPKAARAAAAADNRINPKNRREGKEGSEKAKLDVEEAKELYIRRKRRLEQIHAQQKELTRDRKLLATNRARMQARLIETARALRHSEQRLGIIDENLTRTRAKVQQQRATLEEKTSQMSWLFAMMQGMSRQPPPLMITHSRDALNMIRSGMVLATFYSDIEKLSAELSADIARLEKTQRDAERQEQRRKLEQAQNGRLKSQIDLLLIENRQQLEATETDLEGLDGVAKIQAANLRNLEEMVPKLDEEVAKKSGLGVYEAELKQGAAEIAPDAAKLALLQPGRMKPSLPFDRAQGLLPMPVQGKTVLKFGQPDRDGFASKGMQIQTRNAAQVISPCDGWVIYAGPFRSYGQLLIVNPGGGYHIVIAGMDRIEAAVGQFVLAGEPIAAMGSVESRNDEKTAGHPTLYVEFRRDRQSIDPAPWWSAGVGKG